LFTLYITRIRKCFFLAEILVRQVVIRGAERVLQNYEPG
jgi:hypothetical protein